jgi:hypothetical protein
LKLDAFFQPRVVIVCENRRRIVCRSTLPIPLVTFFDELGLPGMSEFIESPMLALAVARVKELLPETFFLSRFKKFFCRRFSWGERFSKFKIPMGSNCLHSYI